MTSGYYSDASCDLYDFRKIVTQQANPADTPLAADVQNNIPLYDMKARSADLRDAGKKQALMAEWANVLRKGAGVIVLKGAYADTAILDNAAEIFDRIIADEKQASGGGDHFAASGVNDRIWNSLQKLCEIAPDVHLRYFANLPIAAICEAWLGPAYQMTAQVNLVHPGGAAQKAHRDYHLGFQSAQVSGTYPAHVHDLSPALTLQGAIAHCYMPIESGPTKLLPFSQLYRPGYMAWRRDDFRAYFEENFVQLPLQKGDAVFFNPALFHAAGDNKTSDIHRLVNLLQISSAFGRAMETVDRSKMCKLVYPYALSCALDVDELAAAITATAEGYSFPTNLDRDPPVGGLTPQTQAGFMQHALQDKMPIDVFENTLDAMGQKTRA